MNKMELTLFEVKVLKYIDRKRTPVKQQELLDKFGEESKNVTCKLRNSGYLKCPDFISREQLGFGTEDDWEITEEGRDFLKSCCVKNKLAKRQALKERLIGFAFGVLTTVAAQLIIKVIIELVENKQK